MKEIKVGDTVRFVCNKMDEDGRTTDRVMKVTGKLVEIEPVGSCSETSFPKYWVKRNGSLLWYSGDKLQLIKQRKAMSKEQIKSAEEVFAKASAGKYIFGSTDVQVAKDMHNIVYSAMEEYANSRLSDLQTTNTQLLEKVAKLEYRNMKLENAFTIAKNAAIRRKKRADNVETENQRLREALCDYNELQKMLTYSGKYQISIQFWGQGNTNVYIEKDDVDLVDFGGLNVKDAIKTTLNYLNRITKAEQALKQNNDEKTHK